MEKLINALFPAKCLFCSKTDSLFCKECLEKCWIIDKDFCIVCDRFSFSGRTHIKCMSQTTPASVFSCFSYFGIARKCLKESKFGAKQFHALKILVKEGIKHALACGKTYKDFVVVPIPVSKERVRSRGFNQAEIVSKMLCKAYNLKHENSILLRQESTAYQFTKNRRERFDNLRGAFVAVGDSLESKNILLVDDLTTTGATLLEASKVLYLAGAKEVHCFTLCKREKHNV